MESGVGSTQPQQQARGVGSEAGDTGGSERGKTQCNVVQCSGRRWASHIQSIDRVLLRAQTAGGGARAVQEGRLEKGAAAVVHGGGRLGG